jgi:hypothetical protein
MPSYCDLPGMAGGQHPPCDIAGTAPTARTSPFVYGASAGRGTLR